MNSPFLRFTDSEVREILRNSGLSEELSDQNVARIGLVPLRTQRERILDAYRVSPDVDDIFDALTGSVPKSSIRSILCRAYPKGPWRQRRRRRT